MSEISEIDIEQFAEAQDGAVVVVDVRETDEFTAGHVPGAISLPLSELTERYEEITDKGALLIICQRGGRSMQACEFLSPHGVEVTNIAGGTQAWIDSGRDVVTGS